MAIRMIGLDLDGTLFNSQKQLTAHTRQVLERAIARVEDPLEREVLRLRYHEESCSGLNYRRASEETTDECLSEILLELSHDEYRHARQLLCLLEKQMPI